LTGFRLAFGAREARQRSVLLLLVRGWPYHWSSRATCSCVSAWKIPRRNTVWMALST